MSALLRCEVTDHADIELALYEPHDARGFGAIDTERLGHQCARALDEPVADLREPARGCRAVHFVDRSDLVDGEPIDELVAEQRAVSRRELGERRTKRVGELGAIASLELFERR